MQSQRTQKMLLTLFSSTIKKEKTKTTKHKEPYPEGYRADSSCLIFKAPAQLILDLSSIWLTPVWQTNQVTSPLWTLLYLKACCDGGKLIICCLRISNQVVPACEHFPAEIKTSIIPTTIIIRISCHSTNARKTDEVLVRNISETWAWLLNCP